MKSLFLFSVLVVITASPSPVSAQITPAGAGNKDLRDGNIRGRSNELERIKRSAQKPNKNTRYADRQVLNGSQPEDVMAAKYEEIKTDFEQIQKSQDLIISAYRIVYGIDYQQIGRSANEINKSASRLRSNLFAAVVESAQSEEVKPVDSDVKRSKNIKDIIVDLDDTIGRFATSSMFQNLRVIDPAVSEKTRIDLERIVGLSSILGIAARKLASAEK